MDKTNRVLRETQGTEDIIERCNIVFNCVFLFFVFFFFLSLSRKDEISMKCVPARANIIIRSKIFAAGSEDVHLARRIFDSK